MDYQELLRKRDAYQERKHLIPELTIASYERAFEIEYTHHSTAIEGNTLTLMETKLVLEDRISVGGKRLRELYEPLNHALDEKIIKDIHAMLMQNIMVGGVYRNVDVYISGAQHTPPSPNEMYRQIKNFYADLSWKGQQLNLIELAAWTHAEFVKIHPYPDGNGRTSRLIMNYQLMANDFAPISIAKGNRLDYFNALEAYAVEGDISPFAEMLAELEEVQLDRYLAMIEQAQVMNQQL